MNMDKQPHSKVNPWQLLLHWFAPSSQVPTSSPSPWRTPDPVVSVEGEGVVDQPIPPYGQGRVYYQGSWWPATSVEEATLLKGQIVRAVQRQNLTLLVTPVISILTPKY